MSKTYLRTCAPSEDSDQTAHLRSLIRIFTGHIFGIAKDAKFLTVDNEDADQITRMHMLIHYENTPIQMYRKFHLQILKIFR